jgi:protein-S-isoprenylcysteine O-methyltransferase Ste14
MSTRLVTVRAILFAFLGGSYETYRAEVPRWIPTPRGSRRSSAR